MQDRIFTICENLTKSGIKPTAERVRDELGSGSFSTISPIIKQWRGSQGKTELIQEIPPEAQAAVNQATALIWKIASEHQADAINAVRLECTRIEQESIDERDEALREVKSLEEQAKTLQISIDALQSQLNAIAGEKTALQLELQKQQLTIDSINATQEELKAEMREIQRRATDAQAEGLKDKNVLQLEIEKQNLLLDELKRITEQLKTENTALKNAAEIAQKTSVDTQNTLELQVHRLGNELLSNTAIIEKSDIIINQLRTELEKSKMEKATLDGKLIVYESIGMLKEPEPVIKHTTRKAKPV